MNHNYDSIIIIIIMVSYYHTLRFIGEELLLAIGDFPNINIANYY